MEIREPGRPGNERLTCPPFFVNVTGAGLRLKVNEITVANYGGTCASVGYRKTSGIKIPGSKTPFYDSNEGKKGLFKNMFFLGRFTWFTWYTWYIFFRFGF